MSEPFVPEPDPQYNSNWDPAPPHCSVCNVLLQSTRPLGEWDWQGWCPVHGWVPAVYPTKEGNG